MWATYRGVSSAQGRDRDEDEEVFIQQKRPRVDKVQSFRGAEDGPAQEWMFAGVDRHTGVLGSRLYGVIYARVSSPAVIVPDAAPSWRSLEHLKDIYDEETVNDAVGRYEQATDFFEQTALPRGCVLMEAQNRVAKILRAHSNAPFQIVAPMKDRPCCSCGVMGAAVGLRQCCFNPAYDLKEQECQFVVCGECRMKAEFQHTLAINLERVRQQCPQCVSGGITSEPTPIVCPCHSPSEIIRAACIMRARQADEDALMGGIDQDPQEQYDEWMDEADQRTNAHFRMITSLNQADDGLSPTVPANSTDLARVKSDEEPAVKPRRKEKADMARVSNPWSDTDCTAVKEGRNGWDQVTKTAFVAALLNARPASEKEVFTRYASISTTSFKVGLPKKLWNQAAYYEFARYICSEYPAMFACGLKSELKLLFTSDQSCQGGDTVCIAKILPFAKPSYLTLMANHAVQQTELKQKTVAMDLSATVKAFSVDSPMIKKRPPTKSRQ